MSSSNNNLLVPILALLSLLSSGCGGSADRSAGGDRELRVLLVPADGGTEEGTKMDFEPLFQAVGRETGRRFSVRVGQSYTAVVQAMANGQVDIAFFGAVTYLQARNLNAAELLAVGVREGESVYYSAIFVRKDSGIGALSDLKGKSVAFGDLNSTSSFNYPVAMLLEAGIDPVADLGKIILAGSHANALAALDAGKVDAACASLTSYSKAVENGQIAPEAIQIVEKSEPIPYPPLAMHPSLELGLKEALREGFRTLHESTAINREMLRGYGGQTVDRYDVDFPEAEFDRAMTKLARVTDELKAEILRKAGER
ncbi:MAG: phosphate/phosphite/phosphonate ABC transporter substrate-binding protein [Verrucomicrobiae bacterium]|nr:phosphate/phosphite/phosphonate ABC transporter substrate-binding protein [Verrucomicrobiae bacterium]